jgi:hypothetical protein
MSDNPLNRISRHDRVSLRAILVHQGEDAAAALVEAGFVDVISVPVVLGEDVNLPGGILGDANTPNLIAVLETEPDDASGSSPGTRAGAAQSTTRGSRSGSARSAGDGSQPSGSAAADPPPALGMQPMSPVREHGMQRSLARFATNGARPPNPATTGLPTAYGKPQAGADLPD